ncbi:hypothetical protein DFJ74DRAFT_75820 [Hyaloraphidium curvatum]|nr:hypothetical protein DFJ74DRAFT_75820 [Hyaloraphidium curvatum]
MAPPTVPPAKPVPVPARPADPRGLYSFSTVSRSPVAPDYFRAAYAELFVSRKGSAAVEGSGPFAGRGSQLVTVVRGNIPLILTAGHGGTAPIPIDFDGTDAKDRDADGGEPDAADVLTEEDASAFFVPPRSANHLPGFATVRDHATDRLAEKTFLHLMALLNPGADLSSPDLSSLADSDLKVPHLVVARFSRRFCDANRPAPLAQEHPAALAAYRAYHDPIARAVASFQPNPALLLDIHGQSEKPHLVLRGTNDGISVSRLLATHGRPGFDETPGSLLGKLEHLGLAMFPSGLEWQLKNDPAARSIIDSRVAVRGFQPARPGHPHNEPPPFTPETVSPLTPSTVRESPGYRGGWTVQRYGSHAGLPTGHTWAYDVATGERGEVLEGKPPGVDAVQLEIGRDYRLEEKLEETAEKIARAVAAYFESWLLGADWSRPGEREDSREPGLEAQPMEPATRL